MATQLTEPRKSGPTLVKGARASRTTIALKMAMAISGAVFIGFVLAHMYGNLKAFAGHDAFNEYAEHLREIGEPMLPHEGLLWILRVGLIASLFVHVYCAVVLWRRAAKARAFTAAGPSAPLSERGSPTTTSTASRSAASSARRRTSPLPERTVSTGLARKPEGSLAATPIRASPGSMPSRTPNRTLSPDRRAGPLRSTRA